MEPAYCLQHLVQSKWNIIEQIHDHIVRLRNSGPSDLPRLKTLLEGFEFVDIISEPTQIRPRMIEIQSTAGDWVELMAQNETVNLFGSGFGDLILPAASEDQHEMGCIRKDTIPRGKLLGFSDLISCKGCIRHSLDVMSALAPRAVLRGIVQPRR